MPLPQNSIGPLPFIVLAGNPQPPGTQLGVDARMGVEGLQFTDTLSRGEPFVLTSRVDVPTRDWGLAYFHDEYLQAVREGLLDLVQSDFDWSTKGVQVKVLKVRLLGCFRCPVIVGRLTPGTFAILEAEWELVMVRTPDS